MQAWTRRRSTRFVLILAALGLLLAAPIAANASSATEPARVKYYVVTAGVDGEAETVPQIALRLLGSEDRAKDIYELNEGRRQPDGGTLTAGGVPHVGWVLVLPWDAVGDEVRYGELPEATSAPATSTPVPSAGPTNPADPACPGLPASIPGGNLWAQQRLSPQDAWPAAGRGGGVLVAVVDSGVDASVPQLSGRVSAGVDVVTGAESGATDCLGTGTAMAALIAADDPRRVLGVAPDATVLPVRVAVDEASASATDQATAIHVAVSAGARVVALGSYVDLSLPGVRQAIDNATAHDVVVVAAGPVPDDGALPPQLLRVGMLNSDGRLAQDYPAGTIDVVAPGQDVTSLGPAGQGPIQVSGAQYAVALVAGAAALVRGAAPELPAEDVVERLHTTATPLDPDETGPSGDGSAALVNPVKAAMASVAPGSGHDGGSNGVILVSVALLLLTLLAGVLLLRRLRAARTADEGGR